MTLIQDLLALPQVQAVTPAVLLIICCAIALPQTLLHVALHPLKYIVSNEPFDKRLKALRQKFFYDIWKIISPIFNAGELELKKPLLARAHGTVLEIGAGVGSHINSYIRSKVTRLILVEPNANMHAQLRAKANEAGFYENDGSLLLLGCGGAATDETPLSLAGVGTDSVDTIVSIHVLCGIPGPAQAIEMYRRILRSGGLFLFYEHVQSTSEDAAGYQELYTTYVWPQLFDGCMLTRPTGALIAAGPTAIEKPLSNGLDLVDPVKGWDERVKRRWSEFHIKTTPKTTAHTLLPEVVGWGIKS